MLVSHPRAEHLGSNSADEGPAAGLPLGAAPQLLHVVGVPHLQTKAVALAPQDIHVAPRLGHLKHWYLLLS